MLSKGAIHVIDPAWLHCSCPKNNAAAWWVFRHNLWGKAVRDHFEAHLFVCVKHWDPRIWQLYPETSSQYLWQTNKPPTDTSAVREAVWCAVTRAAGQSLILTSICSGKEQYWKLLPSNGDSLQQNAAFVRLCHWWKQCWWQQHEWVEWVYLFSKR